MKDANNSGADWVELNTAMISKHIFTHSNIVFAHFWVFCQ